MSKKITFSYEEYVRFFHNWETVVEISSVHVEGFFT